MSAARELRESKDDFTSSPLMIPAEDEMRVAASNLPDRTLTLLHVLGQPFIVTAPLSRQPHSPGHPSRLPQHLHHAHAEVKAEQLTRSASPPPPRGHYGPLCSGWLWLQKTAGKWKRMWCEYADGQITYRDDETSRKAKGSVQVTFIEAEVNPYRPQPAPTPPTLPVSPQPVRQGSYHAPPSPAAAQQAEGGDHVLPSSPVLTTSVSSPLASPTTSRAQPPVPSRPPLTINTLASPPPPAQPASASGAPSMDDLNDSLARLAMSPPQPPLAPSTSASPPSPSLFLASPTPPSLPSSKYDELYFQYLDQLEHPYTFKVFAPARVYYFRADTAELRQHFLSTIRTHLQSSSLDNNPLYHKKVLASAALASCLHEQFMLQLHRYNLLVKALAKMTMEDELPITSTRKEYSGVLCMETTSEGSVKWRDYYFVLFERALFYYKDSKSTTPTGFITLRYATITIDVSKMVRNDFVFHVITPLRTIACRTKHLVALAEWITALEQTLASHVNQNQLARDRSAAAASRERLGSFGGPGLERQISGGSSNPARGDMGPSGAGGMGERERSQSDNGVHVVRVEKEKGKSSGVLQSINKFIADVQLFNSLIGHPAGLEGFRKFLAEERERRSALALEFYLATSDYINTQPSSTTPPAAASSSSSASSPSPIAPSAADLFPAALAIQRRFFTPESPDSLLPFLPNPLTAPFTNPLTLSPSITLGLFDPLRRALSSVLTADYNDFKRTSDYEQLSSSVLQSSSAIAHSMDDRLVDPFDSSSLQLFLLKVKGTKRSKEIKFNKKEALWTIGRDKSNKLVIEDSRVSRSHARVEYSDSQCEYIDLGSSQQRSTAPATSSTHCTPPFNPHLITLSSAPVAPLSCVLGCGSKLNGKPVLRAKLKAGDVIELGQSTLIFQVKPKKRFRDRLWGGGKE